MAKDNYHPSELPPLSEILREVRNQEQKKPAERKLSIQELIEQLKEHFGKDDLGKLINTLSDSGDLERTTTCPILQRYLDQRNQPGYIARKFNAEIKIIKTNKGDSNNVVCEFYLPERKCRIQIWYEERGINYLKCSFCGV